MNDMTPPGSLSGVRADFPGLLTPQGERWHYLDTAATAQKPQAVIDAMSNALGRDYATVHRGVYARSANMTRAYEAARERVHHSNIVPWQLIAQKTGAEIDVCPITDDGLIDLDWLEENLTTRHKMVALAHVSNVLGSILGAKRAAKAAHAVGAKLLLDGCQSAPRMRLAMEELDCDFFVFSAHKLYGPTGIGVVWAREELLNAMPPYQGGGAMIDRVTFEKSTYAPAPQRFEAGTPMIAEAVALHAAIDYTQNVAGEAGMEGLFAHESGLAAKAREEMGRINSIRLLGPEKSAGIVSFVMEGVHPHDLGTILDEENVAIRAGHHCCQPLMNHLGVPATARASFGLYSDESDIEALMRGIERTQRIFG